MTSPPHQDPAALASMVKNQQRALLEDTFGGVEGLARLLGCADVRKGLDGTNAQDLKARQRRYGKNELDPPEVPWYLGLVYENMQDVTILMLCAAAIVSLVLAISFEEDKSTAWIEGVAIIVAVTFVVNFQAWTDYNNAVTFKRQQQDLENERKVTVIRNNGETVTVHPRELVVGDILRFSMGSILPADGVLVDGRGVNVDEAALTGESKPMEKNVHFIGSATPFLLSGTSVVSGTGRMLVCAVGANSLQGQILAIVTGNTTTKNKKEAPVDDEVEGPFSASEDAGGGGRHGGRGKAPGTGSELPVVREDVEASTPGQAIAASTSGTDVRLPELDVHLAHGGGAGGLSSVAFSLPPSVSRISVGGGGPGSRAFSRKMTRGKFSRFCRKLFSFNKMESGGTLTEKLDHLALDIGKFGLMVAIVVFVVMCVRWAVTEFQNGGSCVYFNSNITRCSLEADNFGCSVGSSNLTCNRVWHSETDASDLLRFFITAVTILVVVVPEGLPLAVTLSLSFSMRRMRKDKNKVKNMESSETMGSATTICTDKTGTLTENQMTCVRVTFGVGNSAASYAANEHAKDTHALKRKAAAAKNESHDDDEATHVQISTGISLGKRVVDAGAVRSPVLELFVHGAVLTSDSSSKLTITQTAEGTAFRGSGNSTDCALLRFAHELGFDYEQIQQNPLFAPAHNSSLDWGVAVYPFSSARKRSSIVVPKAGGGFRLFTKGAPQYILDACTSYLDPATESVLPLTPQARLDVDNVVSEYANSAMRTIAVAFRDFPTWLGANATAASPASSEGGEGGQRDGVNEVETQTTLVGVVGIEDPLRAAVYGAVQDCYTAGVDVRMCTGDALETAVAIARQCNILRAEDVVTLASGKVEAKKHFAMTGAEFDELIHERDYTKPKVLRRAFDFKNRKQGEMLAPPFKVDEFGNRVVRQDRFDEIWPKLRVLARCLPEDKLALVHGIRKSELFRDTRAVKRLRDEFHINIFPDYQVVAVTGDGTNDAPAMKEADVGFAMGIVGTDIAKQASDIILTDDNFASIIKAIKWGRNVFDSISKFVQFQLTVNLVAIVIASFGAFAYARSPLSAVQMLWVNMIMDSFAAFALATDPPSPELLDRAPYGKRRPMISTTMTFNIVGQAVFQVALLLALLLDSSWIPDESWAMGNVKFYPPPNDPMQSTAEELHTALSVHWTIVFNTFVMLQLANEINARKLQTVPRLRTAWQEWVAFLGIHRNPYFIAVVGGTFVAQIIIVQFAGRTFSVVPLHISQWVFCCGLGSLGWIWQLVINVAQVVWANRNESATERRAQRGAVADKMLDSDRAPEEAVVVRTADADNNV